MCGLLAPGALYVSVVYTVTALPAPIYNIKNKSRGPITSHRLMGLDSTTKVDSAKKPSPIILGNCWNCWRPDLRWDRIIEQLAEWPISPAPQVYPAPVRFAVPRARCSFP